MKYLKEIGSLTVILLLVISCTDFFEVSVELDVAAHQSKLAATAFIKNESISNKVIVSYSVGATEEVEDNQLINNATIHLDVEGEEIPFSLSDSDGIYMADSEITMNPNTKYTLRISAPNYETISSSQILPDAIPILEVSIDSQKLTVRFKDEVNTANYYILELRRQIDDLGIYEPVYLYPFGVTSNRSSITQGVLFKDDTFNGEEYEIIAYHSLNNEPEEPIALKAVLYSVTEDFYRYDRTFTLYEETGDSPFTEPVILHRNFDKGYGIFALLNSYEFEFVYE